MRYFDRFDGFAIRIGDIHDICRIGLVDNERGVTAGSRIENGLCHVLQMYQQDVGSRSIEILRFGGYYPWMNSITTKAVDENVKIGHVHLKVADLDRALAFYCGVLGFELMQRYGTQAAFISAGGYHHHIGLNTWESAGGTPPAAGTTGLYHFAILYPTRKALADALRRLQDAHIQLDGASDHGVSEALYLRDPDGNGLELYWDRPAEEWPRAPNGDIQMYTRPLDLNVLLAEEGK